ncbi:MAG TPA: DJ-1/PfpI family protein [Lachnospiraceae bacterium]|nr:DJ-1/PfpI family protein [Lachnospiraceae bacterium]HPF29884.1 DJ-1/PfpI family protein [Lachnospiraceae bacterium]
MCKVAVFLADGFEEVEALTAVDILRRGGVDVTTVSVMGSTRVNGSHRIIVQADEVFDVINFDELDMIILPGGLRGRDNLAAFEPLTLKLQEFAKNNRYIAAICAAPTILGRLGILKGKCACCYADMEAELTGAKVSFEDVVVSDNIITSRGMGTSLPFALKLLEVLKNREESEQMARKVIYTA